jgi:hypothetical protein
VLVAEDRHPLTSSVIRSFGELLTRQIPSTVVDWPNKRYPMISLLPLDEVQLPLGMHRVIRIATIGDQPASVDQPYQATVVISSSGSAPRQLGDLADWMPSPGVDERVLAIDHSISGAVSVNWPIRWATTGRSIADLALGTLSGDGPLPLDVDGLTLADMHGEWPSQVPQQPEHQVLRWYSAFQAPLVRGWWGGLIGQNILLKAKDRSTWTVLDEHLSRGGWSRAEDAVSTESTAWTRSGGDALQRFIAEPGDFGWDVGTIQVFDGAVLRHRQWLAQAKAGDPTARVQLRRHLLSPALPAQQQNEAIAILRDGTDAREAALIGLHPAATPAEQTVSAWLAWLRERGPRPEDTSVIPELALGAWDGRARLGWLGGRLLVLQSDADQRVEIWSRSPEGRLQRSRIISGLRIVADAEGFTLSAQ